jgi:DnaJ-domain-containing protein 1
MAVCILVVPLAVLALGTGPQADADAQVATAIERALIERACNVSETSRALATDAQQQCLSAQLLSLRTAFGRDLSRLSAADRKAIDGTCGRLRTFERREIYVDCLAGQLDAVRLRLDGANSPAPSKETAVAATAPSVPAAAPAPPARSASSWLSVTLMVAAAAILAAGVFFFAVKPRRAQRRCRTCGASVSHADLCAACRHEAAEALRQAAEERAHDERAQEEEERRQRAHEAEQREQRARDSEQVRQKEQEVAHKGAQAALEEVQAQFHAVLSPIAPSAEENVFDPYVVLGLAPDARPEEIGAAYQKARSRYHPDLVSHLGDDAQAYFKAKAEAIERAYQALTGQVPLTARGNR